MVYLLQVRYSPDICKTLFLKISLIIWVLLMRPGTALQRRVQWNRQSPWKLWLTSVSRSTELSELSRWKPWKNRSDVISHTLKRSSCSALNRMVTNLLFGDLRTPTSISDFQPFAHTCAVSATCSLDFQKVGRCTSVFLGALFTAGKNDEKAAFWKFF